MNAKEIETSEHAAEHRAGNVAAVEEAQPSHALRRRLDPARDGRQRRAHEERRWQQAKRAEQATDEEIRRPVKSDREVQTAGVRQPPQHQ